MTAKHQRKWAENNREYIKAYQLSRYREHKRRLDEIKLKSGCVDCGYRQHPAALDFDHKPGSVKSFVISSKVTSSWPLLEAEIEKCEVRCANCHRVITAKRREDLK